MAFIMTMLIFDYRIVRHAHRDLGGDNISHQTAIIIICY